MPENKGSAMKSIRVLITGHCNAACPNCINKLIRKDDSIISTSVFEEICRYFSENGVANIRIMGGEPTTHPDFVGMIQIAQSYFERVTIFTNGISERICEIEPREKDGINYNFQFIKYLSNERLLVDKPGTRIFEVIVTSSSAVEVLIKDLKSLRRYSLKQVIVSLSLDCTENIFRFRKILLCKLEAIYKECLKLGYETIFDHTLPICFLYGSNIPIRKAGAICNGDCAGMIDSELNVYFCNQISKDKFSLKDNGRLIPYSVLNNYMELMHMKNQIKVLEKVCLYCPFYGKLCNGGCFVQADMISRLDIINNTEFPH